MRFRCSSANLMVHRNTGYIWTNVQIQPDEIKCLSRGCFGVIVCWLTHTVMVELDTWTEQSHHSCCYPALLPMPQVKCLLWKMACFWTRIDPHLCKQKKGSMYETTWIPFLFLLAVVSSHATIWIIQLQRFHTTHDNTDILFSAMLSCLGWILMWV